MASTYGCSAELLTSACRPRLACLFWAVPRYDVLKSCTTSQCRLRVSGKTWYPEDKDCASRSFSTIVPVIFRDSHGYQLRPAMRLLFQRVMRTNKKALKIIKTRIAKADLAITAISASSIGEALTVLSGEGLERLKASSAERNSSSL